METITVKVSNRGHIVLPAPLRKAMELKPGSTTLLRREADRLVLVPVRSFTEKLVGLTGKTIATTPKNANDFKFFQPQAFSKSHSRPDDAFVRLTISYGSPPSRG